MIIVISNRNVNQEYNNEYLFGELPNDQGGDKIRIAKADYKVDSKQWALELIPEDNGTNLPSKELFEEIATGISSGTYKRNWVFYIPGYNQSSRSALDASWQISQKYDVDVVLFSWPSNPGGFITEEYPDAMEAAEVSAKALKRTFEKLDKYSRNCPLDSTEQRRISLNLLVHSLGNFVVENYVKLHLLSGITEFFNNIIFHEADVDNKGHKEWIDKIEFGKRIYVTINKNDYVLTGSGAFHLDRLNARNVNNRLGNTTKELVAEKAIYVEFTNGIFVAHAHNLFLSVDNPIVVNFFKQVFQGRPGENNPPFEFDDSLNAYVLD
ncbi:MAG: alpha/beta hydrolase [Xenococcus sp. MO_188.B8]|nr:alpha/beta hydrolase [Xenococcus sp. MO_188.B8]